MAGGRSSQQGGTTASSRPRRGLGNGLGSLIPDAPPASRGESARPLDVLFPDSSSGQDSRARGGSARELLQPRRAAGRRSVSRETSRTAPQASPADSENHTEDKPQSRQAKPTRAEGATRQSAETANAHEPKRGASDTTQATAEDKTASDTHVSRETSAVRVLEDVATPETLSGQDREGTDGHRGDSKRKGDRNSAASRSAEDQLASGRTRVTSTALDAIMGTSVNVSRETSEEEPELLAVPGASFGELRVDEIIPNSRQPREVFDEDELAELAASITEVGVLQPIVVRPIKATDEPTETLRLLLEAKPDARYELIMGERRLRASEIAGNATVPAIIRDTDDDDLLRDALLENLHRVQLNPLEEASAYQQLMADFGATQEELSQRIARSRPQIANTLRLLKLPPAVQRKLAGGSISAGHGRALLGLKDAADMERLAERIVAEGLSVRTTEELVRLGLPRRPAPAKQPREKALSALGERLVSSLSDAFDTRVTISEGRRKGKIVIEFAGKEDLERIAALLTKQ